MSVRSADASSQERPAGQDLNRHNPKLGIALKIGATLAFTVMVVLIKLVADRYPVGELVFARSLFGLLPVLIMGLWQGESLSVVKTARPMGHIGRAIVGGSAMALWFAALARLPLPDATAINFSAPLIMVALAALLLGERVRVYRWTAVGIGFCGILIILSPHLGAAVPGSDGVNGLGAGFAFGSACMMALAMIQVRRLTSTERTTTIVIWFAGVSSVLALLTAPFGWVMPNAEDALILVAVGLFGGIGQILMTHCYRFAEASTIAPFEYTTMLWTVIAGWLVFAEVPTIEVLIGACFVIGAGVFVIFREQALGLDRSKERRTVTPSKA